MRRLLALLGLRRHGERLRILRGVCKVRGRLEPFAGVGPWLEVKERGVELSMDE